MSDPTVVKIEGKRRRKPRKPKQPDEKKIHRADDWWMVPASKFLAIAEHIEAIRQLLPPDAPTTKDKNDDANR